MCGCVHREAYRFLLRAPEEKDENMTAVLAERPVVYAPYKPRDMQIKAGYFPYTGLTRKPTALGSLIRPRAVTRCNLAVSDMYMRDFGKTHQIAYTYCSVGISDLKPLTGTSADQLPHRKSRSLATA